MKSSDKFIQSFNRLEKWMSGKVNKDTSLSVSKMIHALAEDENDLMYSYKADLLEFAKLRNAIVHNQIKEDFIIAEPNDWAVNRIMEMEENLLHPEQISSYMDRKLTVLSNQLTVKEMLTIYLAENKSHYPIVDLKNRLQGILTERGISRFLASHIDEGKSAKEEVIQYILEHEEKNTLIAYMRSTDFVFQAQRMYRRNPRLEAIVVTDDGHRYGNLLGIIKAKDLFKHEGEN